MKDLKKLNARIILLLTLGSINILLFQNCSNWKGNVTVANKVDESSLSSPIIGNRNSPTDNGAIITAPEALPAESNNSANNNSSPQTSATTSTSVSEPGSVIVVPSLPSNQIAVQAVITQPAPASPTAPLASSVSTLAPETTKSSLPATTSTNENLPATPAIPALNLANNIPVPSLPHPATTEVKSSTPILVSNPEPAPIAPTPAITDVKLAAPILVLNSNPAPLITTPVTSIAADPVTTPASTNTIVTPDGSITSTDTALKEIAKDTNLDNGHLLCSQNLEGVKKLSHPANQSDLKDDDNNENEAKAKIWNIDNDINDLNLKGFHVLINDTDKEINIDSIKVEGNLVLCGKFKVKKIEGDSKKSNITAVNSEINEHNCNKLHMYSANLDKGGWTIVNKDNVPASIPAKVLPTTLTATATAIQQLPKPATPSTPAAPVLVKKESNDESDDSKGKEIPSTTNQIAIPAKVLPSTTTATQQLPKPATPAAPVLVKKESNDESDDSKGKEIPSTTNQIAIPAKVLPTTSTANQQLPKPATPAAPVLVKKESNEESDDSKGKEIPSTTNQIAIPAKVLSKTTTAKATVTQQLPKPATPVTTTPTSNLNNNLTKVVNIITKVINGNGNGKNKEN